MSGEKTEKPTEQKKKQARREGRIARTPDLGVWGGMLVASFVLPMTVSKAMDSGRQLFARSMEIVADPQPDRALALAKKAATALALDIAPLTVGLFAVAILASAAQGGLRPATKLFKPDFKKVNPFTGIKRMFGGQAYWEGAKALLKTAVLGVVVYRSVKELVPALLASSTMPIETLLGTVGGAILGIIRSVSVAGLVLAVADFAMARRRVGKQLRMSKQEVKDEHRKSEGDPQVKGQIRARQLEMARSRMMSDIPKADVVLVNPTHVAVALRYDPSRGAPRVIAKGAGAAATKIREKAAEHRIPMVQDVPLARALYKSCDLGDEIPAEFFGAVARVLAFIMMLKAKGSAAGVHRSALAA